MDQQPAKEAAACTGGPIMHYILIETQSYGNRVKQQIRPTVGTAAVTVVVGEILATFTACSYLAASSRLPSLSWEFAKGKAGAARSNLALTAGSVLKIEALSDPAWHLRDSATGLNASSTWDRAHLESPIRAAGQMGSP